jgi:hypothetical protein
VAGYSNLKYMTNKELIRYLMSQDEHAEVTVFDGFKKFKILDILDTQIITDTEKNKEYCARISKENNNKA